MNDAEELPHGRSVEPHVEAAHLGQRRGRCGQVQVEACVLQVEPFRDVAGELLGAGDQGEQVVHRGAGGLARGPGLEVPPVVLRIPGVEQRLAAAEHRPQPLAQVVVDVGGEVLDAVGEHGLPRRRTAGQVLAPPRLLRQPVGQRSALVGILDRRPLGADLLPELGDHEARRPARVVWTAAASAPARTPRRSMSSSSGKPGLVVERRAVPRTRAHPQERRDRHDRQRQSGAREVAVVEVDDPSPLAVQVGLRHHADDPGTPLHGADQEIQFGGGELLRGVGDEQRGARQRQRAEREVAVRGVQPADAGSVDEGQATAEQAAVRRTSTLRTGGPAPLRSVTYSRSRSKGTVHRRVGRPPGRRRQTPARRTGRSSALPSRRLRRPGRRPCAAGR